MYFTLLRRVQSNSGVSSDRLFWLRLTLTVPAAPVKLVEGYCSANEAERIRIIEVNSSPAIRLLEDSGRDDLVLRIWHSTFVAVGLLDASVPV